MKQKREIANIAVKVVYICDIVKVSKFDRRPPLVRGARFHHQDGRERTAKNDTAPATLHNGRRRRQELWGLQDILINLTINCGGVTAARTPK